jgi:hypothetical protein
MMNVFRHAHTHTDISSSTSPPLALPLPLLLPLTLLLLILPRHARSQVHRQPPSDLFRDNESVDRAITPAYLVPRLTLSPCTGFDKDSFLGKLRSLYASTVLDTQLAQMKKQGSYEAFNLKHHPAYDVRPLKGARSRQDGIPPSLFWESDVGKW